MKEEKDDLMHHVNDVPPIPTILLLGFQQMMICLSMLLVVPFLVSDMVCPGDKETEIRYGPTDICFFCDIWNRYPTTNYIWNEVCFYFQPLSHTNLRLAILHGPSFAYLPVLNTFQTMYPCNEHTDTSLWQQKIQMISGSCLIAVLVMPLFGFTGIIGFLSKFIGPITIVPIISLLTISAVPDVEQKMSLHWMSSVEFLILVVFIVLLEHWEMPLPAFSFSEKRFHVIRKKVLSQFPVSHSQSEAIFPSSTTNLQYIIGIGIGWFICFILTVINAIPINSSARTDQNSSIETLRSTPWFHIPIPGQYGTPTINVSLLCGFIASSFVAMIESIGDYNLCAQLSKQGRIPESNLNRGFVVEGIGCMLSSSFGIGTGITTYAENIAIMSVTKVASRITMQVAGVFLLAAGIFSKFSAVLAMIPEPVVGGVLAIGICMVNGVMLRNLLTVDLRLSRNLTIMGISIIMGLTVALHFENNPLKSGNQTVDNVFGTLLTIRMLIGGIIAFTLDNITPGATREQRGFRRFDESGDDGTLVENNGYALPSFVNRFFLKYRWLTYIPLVPSRDEIMDIEEKRMEIKYKL
ncbi:hypothetical protein CRE_14411 [Caenorhabditis remanei]|uniref:Uncharacterized protein n=1 Tax=Caenorhabditis remanei TaxID=31234 RepID=E3NQT9_CAERE|nr:hypothetical protein CRE_14411 [Caenorhabditis remanei]